MEIRDLIQKFNGKDLRIYTISDRKQFNDLGKDVIRDAFNERHFYVLNDSALTPFSDSGRKILSKIKIFGKIFHGSFVFIDVPSSEVLHPIRDENRKLIGDYVGNCVCVYANVIRDTELGNYLLLYLLYKAKKITKKQADEALKYLKSPRIYKTFLKVINKSREDRLRRLRRNIRDNVGFVTSLKRDLERTKQRIEIYKKDLEKEKRTRPVNKKTIEEQIKQVRKLPFVKKVDLTGNKLIVHFGKIKIRSEKSKKKTKRLLMTTLGSYRFEIIFRPPESVSYFIYNSILEDKETYQHPHVDTHGTMCEGKLHPDDYIKNCQLSVLIQYVYDFISGYNSDSPFITIGRFKLREKRYKEGRGRY